MGRIRGAKRLDLVVNLARRRREEADQYLRESADRVSQAEKGLVQLEEYLQEYMDASRLKQGENLTALQLQMPTAFIGRLRSSVSQQKQVVDEFRQQHLKIEEWWRKLYAREKAIIKLQNKLRDQESIAEEKVLQKQIDELWQNRPVNHI